MVYLPNFDAREWVRLVDAEEVTTATVVPTMLDRIVTVLEAGGHELPSLRNLAYGGSKVGLPLVRRALELLPGVGFVNAYGLTETSSTIAVLDPDDHRAAHSASEAAVIKRLGSVGQPVPGIELEIRDDEGNVVAVRARPASFSCEANRSPAATPGSAPCSTKTAGSQPKTSRCSTTRATCSSAGAATTPSSAAGRTSHPPSWRRC